MQRQLRLNVRQADPLNAGPSVDLLCESNVTPNDLFYVRNHGNVPTIDPASYRLTVEGLVARPLALSLEELRSQFPKVTHTVTLQCAGNRRQELTQVRPIPSEVDWEADAIGNAVWSGMLLQEVLDAAGIQPDQSLHVAFVGLDEANPQNQKTNFGGSIPLAKAAEALLAYEMNGEPLPPLHGFPLRVIVPGYIGARSVKWLSRIIVQRTPSDNHFQAHAYKLFPAAVRAETADWDTGLMLGEMSLNAVICSVQAGAQLPAGPVSIQGYALAGGNRQVVRVDVSADGGVTWTEAELLGDPQPWAWRLWQAQLRIAPGERELVVRALDSAANIMPESTYSLWNFKGYMNNAWHRVRVKVK